MKKRKIICLTIFVLMFLTLTMYFINKKDSNTIYKDGVQLALMLDGKKITEIPKKGDYTIDIDCKNAKGKWLVDDWKFSLEDITGKVICNIEFESIKRSDLLTEVITSLKIKTDTNTGICSDETYTTKATCEASGFYWWGVIDENGLRFEGTNPDNYVWFNNELWRIIGYLPAKDKNGIDLDLVKIIRSESIAGLSISNTGNTFTDSNLYHILNDYYYKKLDGTKSGYCFAYSNTIGSQCDYREVGLNNSAQQLVESAQWPTGKQAVTKPETHYTSEVKSYTEISGGIKVGLINTSDFGYAALAADCARSKTLVSGTYNVAACAGKNWLWGDGDYWTMSPISTNNMAAVAGAYVQSKATSESYAVRPVVYLSDLAYVVHGTGKIYDPYVIKMSGLNITKIDNDDESITIEVNAVSLGEIKEYYYSINGSEYVKSANNTYKFTGLKINTDYDVSVYVIDENNTQSKVVTETYKTSMEIGKYLMKRPTQGLNTAEKVAGYYRYVGNQGSVNNYVCFGTDNKDSCLENTDKYMYRIIGIENNQLKLIKKEALNSAYAWYSSSYTSNTKWPSSTAYSTLHGSKFYTNTSYVPTDWKDKIAAYDWKYGDYKKTDETATALYNAESAFTSIKNSYIGLLYLHDIKYSGTWLNLESNDSGAPKIHEWSITRYGSRSNDSDYAAWAILKGANPDDERITNTHSLRPVFYLEKEVLYLNGTGTSADPFIIG